jgi:hypothetical protein
MYYLFSWWVETVSLWSLVLDRPVHLWMIDEQIWNIGGLLFDRGRQVLREK